MAVGEDALRPEFERHRAGQVDDAGLGGDERALQAHRGEPDHRGDVDDAPAPARRQHRLQRGAAHHVQPVEVDAGDAVPFLGRKRVDVDAVRERVDAGIVDQDVEAPEALDAGGDRALDRIGGADIDAAGHCVRQAIGDALGAVEIDIGDDDGCAVVGKTLCDDTPDSAGSAGDECDLTAQIATHGNRLPTQAIIISEDLRAIVPLLRIRGSIGAYTTNAGQHVRNQMPPVR